MAPAVRTASLGLGARSGTRAGPMRRDSKDVAALSVEVCTAADRLRGPAGRQPRPPTRQLAASRVARTASPTPAAGDGLVSVRRRELSRRRASQRPDRASHRQLSASRPGSAPDGQQARPRCAPPFVPTSGKTLCGAVRWALPFVDEQFAPSVLTRVHPAVVDGQERQGPGERPCPLRAARRPVRRRRDSAIRRHRSLPDRVWSRAARRVTRRERSAGTAPG